MGEALITRRGGSGGGLGEATFIAAAWPSGIAQTVDPTKTYLLVSSRYSVDSLDSVEPYGGVYLLKDGVVSRIADVVPGYLSAISYYPTSSKIGVGYGGCDWAKLDIYELK